ncbi:hypothetical protein A200_02935 [Parascardovia denticolens IPLA 20019]|uniref:FMN-binding protein n=1 Tax=Parascardovia denticolens TaxID=78258 RepID=UPI000266A393|nr:FMN-binding protein [Parascardovia denticolens]EIT88527.1 hypothetical protein A200_02935 [Parascardovia denticolens IPLA 20019]
MNHSKNQDARKATALAAVGILMAAPLLTACGESRAVPAQDDFAGVSEESSSPASGSGQSTASAAPRSDPNRSLPADSGKYKDGRFASKAIYGPASEDSIDVSVTVSGQKVADVTVTPHPATPVSKKYQTGFIKEIKGTIVGKPLKDLKVTKVAGASWTSDAFNKALDVVRQEASVTGQTGD